MRVQLGDGERHNQGAFLVAFFPVLLAVAPRPEFDTLHLLNFGVVVYVAACLMFVNFAHAELGRRYQEVIAWTGALTLTLLVSACVNANSVTWRAIGVLIRPIILGVVFTFGYLASRYMSKEQLHRGLALGAKIVLVIEAVTSAISVFNSSALSALYAITDLESGGQLRIQGTVGNPNLFGWLVIQCALAIVMFDRSMFWKIFGGVLAFLLILQAGSRSMVVVIFGGLVLCYLFYRHGGVKGKRRSISRWLVIAAVLAGSGGILYFVLTTLASRFPYLGQLAIVLVTGNLNSVNSFQGRMDIWAALWGRVTSDGSALHMFFGLGPGTISSADNDVLFSVVNFGFIFLILTYLFAIRLFVVARHSADPSLSAYLRQYVVLSVLVGLQADTLSGWNYPMLMMFFGGIVYQLSERSEPNDEQVVNPRVRFGSQLLITHRQARGVGGGEG